MKPALIAAVVLAFAVYFAPRCEAEHTSAYVTYSKNYDDPRALAAVFALSIYEKQQPGATDNKASDNDPPNWRKPPEWVLPLIGFVTALIIIWQSWETRRAAQATQRSAAAMESQTGILEKSVAHAEASAKAAEVSAQAAMGIAIPRLMLYSFNFGAMGNASLAAKVRLPKIKIVVKNYGQTPAFLKSYGVDFTCEALPDEPSYAHSKPIPRKLSWMQVRHSDCRLATLNFAQRSCWLRKTFRPLWTQKRPLRYTALSAMGTFSARQTDICGSASGLNLTQRPKTIGLTNAPIPSTPASPNVIRQIRTPPPFHFTGHAQYFSIHSASSRTLILPCHGFSSSEWPSSGKISRELGTPSVCRACSSR